MSEFRLYFVSSRSAREVPEYLLVTDKENRLYLTKHTERSVARVWVTSKKERKKHNRGLIVCTDPPRYHLQALPSDTVVGVGKLPRYDNGEWVYPRVDEEEFRELGVVVFTERILGKHKMQLRELGSIRGFRTVKQRTLEWAIGTYNERLGKIDKSFYRGVDTQIISEDTQMAIQALTERLLC